MQRLIQRRPGTFVALFTAVLLLGLPGTVQAQTVFSAGADLELDTKMLAQDRVFHLLHAYPFGVGLTGSYAGEESLELIRQFLAQNSDDVEAVTGKHPYELFSNYEGPSGIGLRGGGAMLATAFRYMALKKEGASEEKLAPARADVVRLLKYMQVIHVITGVPYGLARGAMLMHSEFPDEPPLPHTVPELIPLFDEEGNPFPPEKSNGDCRPDNSGGVLPAGLWYWVDSCSKDQMVGWVAGMATLYDAAVDDPDIDQSLVEALQEVARGVGEGLRVQHEMDCLDGKTHLYDLVIMDADGRPTQHNDLNPLSIDNSYLPPESTVYNVFNLIMGLGIVKGLYHVSGDPEAESFLYQELLQNRGYLDMVPDGDDSATAMDYLYNGADTNHSNVNMIAIALFLNIYFEKDPTVANRLRTYMEDRWWDMEDTPESARWLKQPYFLALYEAMTLAGTDESRTTETASLLKAFPLGPYVDEERINCDEAELEAGSCLAIDGATELTLKSLSSWGSRPVATEALDPSIRPPSNFNARSNPFEVNGGGGSGILPGGDLLSAYWLMRTLPARPAGEGALSPHARDHRWLGDPPVTEEPDPEVAPDGAPDVVTEDTVESIDSVSVNDSSAPEDTAVQVEGDAKKSSGGCVVGTSNASTVSVLALLLLLLLGLRWVESARSRFQS